MWSQSPSVGGRIIWEFYLGVLTSDHVLLPSAAAAAAKSLQSCLTLCDPIDGSPPGSLVPGILQERTLGWVAISFSSAWKWRWSRSVVSNSLWPHGLQPTRLLHPWDFPGKSTGVGCHCLLRLFPSWWPYLKVILLENNVIPLKHQVFQFQSGTSILPSRAGDLSYSEQRPRGFSLCGTCIWLYLFA